MNNDIEIPQPVKFILDEFSFEIIKGINGSVIGIYVTGSLALNDFQNHKSDIDLVILCSQIPDKKDIHDLKKIHNSIIGKFGVTLNGCYIITEHLDIKNASRFKALYFNNMSINIGQFAMAAITLFEMKASSKTFFGKPLADLDINVSLNDLKDFLHNNINTYWSNWVNRFYFFSLKHFKLLLFPRITEWIILGIARQLYTLQTGGIISKTGAGYFCIENLPLKYHNIIQQAIEIRKNETKNFLSFNSSYQLKPSIKRYKQTIECATFMINYFNEEFDKLESGNL